MISLITDKVLRDTDNVDGHSAARLKKRSAVPFQSVGIEK